MSWTVPASFDEIESRGMLAGVEVNGNKIYVGRTFDKDGNYIPAKIVPAYNSGYYAFDGEEVTATELEFLDNAADFHWVKFDGQTINDAVEVNGFCIGRALYNGNIVVGRVDLTTKELIGSYGGEVFNLPSYDVLIYRAKGEQSECYRFCSQTLLRLRPNRVWFSSVNMTQPMMSTPNPFHPHVGVVYEAIKKASNISSTRTESRQISTRVVSGGGTFETTTSIDNNQNYLNLLERVRSLELENLAYRKDKQSYEIRLDFEQRKVAELSNQLKTLKTENARFSKERLSFEEKFTVEQRKHVDVESKIQEYVLNNSFLLKRVTSLEEAIRYEKLMVESISEKFARSQMHSKSLLTKVTDFEETIKTQQQRVFELESEIMITSSSSDSLLKKVSEYEDTIKHLRLQIETFVKKLEISGADNDFLIKKLAMLTQTLRSYQTQIECLFNNLQSSKTVIATAHSDLSRANAQVSKYQAALSTCYSVNGELMTKVSGLESVSRNHSGVECSLNLVNFSSDIAFKSIGYGKTSSLLEMTGSDDFLRRRDEEQVATPYGFVEQENSQTFVAFQPFTTDAAVNGVSE